MPYIIDTNTAVKTRSEASKIVGAEVPLLGGEVNGKEVANVGYYDLLAALPADLKLGPWPTFDKIINAYNASMGKD